MIFSAELTASSTHIATTERADGAVTISITVQAPETLIISEVHITVSNGSARDLAHKLVRRLRRKKQWSA